jgi:undecaprenyl-diphosphatase
VAPKEHCVALSAIWRVKVDEAFRRLNHTEMPIVASVVAFSQPAPVRTVLHLTNFLTDGWIYSVLLFFLLFEKEWRLLLVSLLAVAICFSVYYATKPVLARVRPCHEAITLDVQPRCLDQYSFPSGHCMTLTVLSVLLGWQHHAIAPILFGAVILLCWARMATAHHYPSDLIAGIGIGVAVGVPIARTLL